MKGELLNQNKLSVAKSSKRENQYDLLRILCMVAVVFIHAVTSQKNQLQQFVLTVSGCAVPVLTLQRTEEPAGLSGIPQSRTELQESSAMLPA